MRYIIIITLVFGILFSCKKNTEYDQYEILTSGSWRLVSDVIDGEETIIPCQEDDIYTFDSKNFRIDEGQNDCLEDYEYKPGKWEFKKDGSYINMNFIRSKNNNARGYIVRYEFEIIALNDTIFKVKMKNSDVYKTYKKI